MTENENQFVTREEWDQDRGRAFWRDIIIMAFVIFILLVIVARADTTKVFQAIESGNPVLCDSAVLRNAINEIVCKWGRLSAYDTIRIIRRGETYGFYQFDGEWYFVKIVDSFPPMDSLWAGRLIPVVRARGLDSTYTLPHDTVICRLSDSIDYIIATLPTQNHYVTVCDTIKIGGRWWYFDWDKGKRTNIRRVK